MKVFQTCKVFQHDDPKHDISHVWLIGGWTLSVCLSQFSQSNVCILQIRINSLDACYIEMLSRQRPRKHESK